MRGGDATRTGCANAPRATPPPPPPPPPIDVARPRRVPPPPPPPLITAPLPWEEPCLRSARASRHRPVNRWVTESARPNRSRAAAESPPPTTVTPGAKAIASGRARSAANGAGSNAPIGRFQKTVPAARDHLAVGGGGRRTDVEPHPPVGYLEPVELSGRRVLPKAIPDHQVHGSVGSAPPPNRIERPTRELHIIGRAHEFMSG